MQPIKIKKKFNQAIDNYEDVTHVQYQCAKQLIDFFIKQNPHFLAKSILDIGSGTGYIPQELLKHFPNGAYYLNDIAENMLARCEAKFSHDSFHYLCGDMDTYCFPSVDLITSNFSLQWSSSLMKTINKLFSCSQKMAITCLVDHTFYEWYALLDSPNLIHYPHALELKSHLLSLDPYAQMFIKSYPLDFENPRAFLNYIHRMGASHSEIKIPRSKLKQLLNADEPFQTQYHVLFAILERK